MCRYGDKVDIPCMLTFVCTFVVCLDVNECLTNPCNANADCVNLDGGYRCYCPPGFEETADGSRCVGIIYIWDNVVNSVLCSSNWSYRRCE